MIFLVDAGMDIPSYCVMEASLASHSSRNSCSFSFTSVIISADEFKTVIEFCDQRDRCVIADIWHHIVCNN
jgi:hypothetical protein